MKKVSALLVSTGLLLTMASASFAASPCPSGLVDCINLADTQQGKGVGAKTPLQNLLSNTFTIVFAVAALTVLAFLIYGAFKWITSGGEKEGSKAARQYITNALVGLAILALAFVIVRVVGGIVGFDILTGFDIPRLDATPKP